jgi:hypothetical protein
MYEFLAALIILMPFLAYWLAGRVLRRLVPRRTDGTP